MNDKLTGNNFENLTGQSSEKYTGTQRFIDEINSEISTLKVVKEDPYLTKFHSSILDQTKDYPSPVPVVTLLQATETIVFLTLKSFSLWQGKQKSRKTTALALTIAAFLCGKIRTEEMSINGTMDGCALFFDTEQGESYAARTLKLILKLAGLESSPRLIYCNLREYSPAERLKIIRAGIENTPNVKLVVIDGLVDLMVDFMDAGEAHTVITEILRLCSLHDIHIAGVLHQNKADKNARAHIGTIASQKCEIEIMTEVDQNDKSKSVVSCLNSRGLPFEPFAIKWEKGSLPCIADEWNSSQERQDRTVKNFDRSKDIADSIFKPFASLTHAKAIESIMQATLKSESTAKRILNDYLGWGLIEKGNDGLYRAKPNKGSRVQQGSKEGS